jgi:hypothetical protein
MSNPTPNVEVLQGSCQPTNAGALTALVGTKTLARSVLIVADSANTNPVKIGYRTNTPVLEAPLSLPPMEGKWYDLNKIVILTSSNADKVNYFATR